MWVCVTVWIFLTQLEDLSIERCWSGLTRRSWPDGQWSACTRFIECTICVFSNAHNCCRFDKRRLYFVSIDPYTDFSVKGDQTFYIRLWDDLLKQPTLSNPITPLNNPYSFSLFYSRKFIWQLKILVFLQFVHMFVYRSVTYFMFDHLVKYDPLLYIKAPNST